MTINLAFGLFLLAMAVVLLVMGWRMTQTDKTNLHLYTASAAWPTVAGAIGMVRIDVNRSSAYDSATSTTTETQSYEPKVAYTYAVGGRDFTGTRINFTRLYFNSEKKAKAVIAPYTVGGAVTVAYDPADPQISVLDRTTKPKKMSGYTILVWVCAVIVALLGIFMLTLPG